MKNMAKKVKGFIAVALAMIFSLRVIPVIGASAALNEPRMYVDFVYEEDGSIRGDIIFENVPDLSLCAFYLDIGDGWNILPAIRKDPDTGAIKGVVEHGITKDLTREANLFEVEFNGNGRFIVFSFIHDLAYDMNGRIAYFYVEKTDKYTSENATANISLASMINNATGESWGIDFKNPVMLSTHEYVIGDVDNDGVVTALDATLILTVTQNQTFSVYEIRNSFRNYFPNAKCAASADIDQNGIIDEDDAYAAMDAYMAAMVGREPNSNAGKLDIFELFD